MERPADVGDFINDNDRFFFQSSGRGLTRGDHKQAHLVTGVDLRAAVDEMTNALVTLIYLSKVAEGEIVSARDAVLPEVPVVENAVEKQAALVWVRMRRQYTWLSYEDLDDMEEVRLQELANTILNDIYEVRSRQSNPGSVPEDAPKEEPPQGMLTGPSGEDGNNTATTG